MDYYNRLVNKYDRRLATLSYRCCTIIVKRIRQWLFPVRLEIYAMLVLVTGGMAVGSPGAFRIQMPSQMKVPEAKVLMTSGDDIIR